MPYYTIQVPEGHRSRFTGMSPHDIGSSQISVIAGTEDTALQDFARDIGKATGLSLGDVETFPIKETSRRIGQTTTQAITSRSPSGLNIPKSIGPASESWNIPGIGTGIGFGPGLPLGPHGVVGTGDPVLFDVFTEGADTAFDPAADLFSFQGMQPTPVPASPASSEVSIQLEAERREAGINLIKEDLGQDYNLNLFSTVPASNVETTLPSDAANLLPGVTTFTEQYKDWKARGKDPLITITGEGGLKEEVLHPELAMLLELSSRQDGYITQAQLLSAEAAGNLAVAEEQRASALDVAHAQGQSDAVLGRIRANADKAIATANQAIEEARFASQAEIETARFNLQSEEAKYRFDTEQTRLEARTFELNQQFDTKQAEDTYRFELQMADTAAEREAVKLRFGQEQARLEAEERERIRAAEERATQQERQIFLQMEQDRITAETNQNIAVIQADVGLDANAKQAAIAREQIAADQELAELQQATAFGVEQTRLSAVEEQAGAEKAVATTMAGAQVGAAESARLGQEAAAESARLGQEAAATTQAGAVTGAAALGAEAAGPFGYVGASIDPADRAQRLTEAQTILGEQYNPYALTGTQFTDMQGLQARAGATPFGALATAPDARYQNILDLQQAQAAQGPFQSLQLGAQGDEAARQQRMADISTIQRGGLTPTQQIALAQAPGNPFGLTATEQMALQNSLARGGLTPTQRLTEVQAGAAPQNMANYLNFIGNPAAVGFAGQSGFLQNVADSPEGNIPASLFGLNVPQNAPTVPVNPTLANLTDLSDEQLGFYQGQMAAQNYQTPSQIYQQAQTVTPQGV